MVEQTPRWQIGQEVVRPRVNAYTIVQLVGEAGNIHIDQKGFYHVYWHREHPDGQIVLIHHGGEDGFKTLSAVKHQHERVILRYTGMMISVPPDQLPEVPQEELQTGLPIVGGDFPTLVRQLRELRLPGEQQKIREWVGVLQDVSQDLPTIRNHGQLTQIREKLDKLLQEKALTRSTNRYKQAAAQSLQRGVGGDRGNLLSGAGEAQLQLLRRAEQTVAITLGTMKRYNDVERLQIFWNELVNKVLASLAHLSTVLNPTYRADFRDRALTTTLEGNSSVFAMLDSLTGEPYYSRARKILDDLSPVKKLWEERHNNPLSYGEMPQVLGEPLKEMAIWKERIQEEYTGVNFGKYSLS